MMTLIQYWMMRMMSPCATATRLASEELDRPLTEQERRSLRLHLLLCRWCRRYEKQLRLLNEILHHHPETSVTGTAPRLSPEARERIKRSLQS
jgi:hypothetical protein